MSNDPFEIEYRGHVIQIGQKDTLRWGVSIDKDFDIVDDTFETRAHALAAAAEWIDKVEQLIENEADGSAHRCRAERPAAAPEERVSREHWHNLVRIFTDLKAQGVPRNEASDTLEYDAEETPAPRSVIEKAINKVYGPTEQKQIGE